MNIAIIGSGSVGQALAGRWVAAGHRVVYGSRAPGAGPGGIERRGISEAAAGAEVIVLAVPWDAMESTLAAVGDPAGKLVLDCTNPLAADLSGLVTAGGPSGGERTAALLAGAAVYKVFNTTGSNIMEDPVVEGRRALMLFCGDDDASREAVRRLIEDVGFEAVDAGRMANAGLLESLALLWIRLAYEQGMGRDFALGILRRES